MNIFKKRFISKIALGSASALIAFSCFGNNADKAADVYAVSISELTDALNSYKTILENIEVSDRYGMTSFSIADLNGDGMPELICDEDSTPVTIDDFYTYKEGETVKLDTSSMDIPRYGNYTASETRNDFCWYRNGPSTTEGIPHEYVEFEIKGNAIVKKDHYYANEKADGTWDCVNDSGKISREAFEAFAASYTGVKIYQNNESNRVVQCKPDKYISEEYTWKGGDGKWWVEDKSGNYPVSQWLQLDENWYYFDSNGYMASSQWIGGWWINDDGTCTYSGVGSWKSDSTGWWYEDSTGWYPNSQWQMIDGNWYYFKANGYMASNEYVGNWWCGADGICK